MIFNIPIEKYEERYTEQWSRWFTKAYEELGLSYVNVEGDQLVNTVETGAVLDVYGTHYYKFSQLQKLMKMLRNNEIGDDDILFFHDLWFPGIEALQYIRNITDKKFKIWGILHAGTWDKNDFTYLNGMRNWAKYVEGGWLQFFDKIFLGSEFHKDLIIFNSLGMSEKGYISKSMDSKLVVTGIPFEYEEVQRSKIKENIVIFPHRLDKEKRPDLFDKLADELRLKYPDWQFIKTKDVCPTKEAYYQLLGKSKIAVSFAEQETFGYAMLEAIANGCIPVVPNKLSYSTMDIYKNNRFKTFTYMKWAIEYLISGKLPDRCPEWFIPQLFSKIKTDNFEEELKQYQTVNIINKIFNEN